MDASKALLLSLLLVPVSFGCATPGTAPEPAPPALLQLPRPQLPPPPQQIMMPRVPNFQQRLLNFFSPSLEKPTTPPASSLLLKP